MAVLAGVTVPAAAQASALAPAPVAVGPVPAAGAFTAMDVGFNGRRADLDAMNAFVPGPAPFLRVELDWWARQGSPGDPMDWTGLDPIVQDAVDRGMRILMVLDYAPPWSSGNHQGDHAYVHTWFPTDDQAWSSMVDATVRHFNEPRFGGRVQAYEVWNEPNLPRFGKYGAETPHEVMVRYWQLTRLAGQAVHAACATCVVVAGPSAGVNDDDVRREPVYWLNWAYANGYGNDFDALAFHPYTFNSGGPDQPECTKRWLNMFGPPDEVAPCGELALVHAAMVAHGDTTKKIWATEWGYPSISAAPTVIRDRLVLGVRMWRSLSYTGPLFLYQYRDSCAVPANNECNFGVVRTDGTRKEPSYSALSDALRYLRPHCLSAAAPPAIGPQQVLYPGDCLKRESAGQMVSPDGRFRLFLQSDGNLVLYVNGVAIWATGTTDGVRLDNQLDGNLVLFRANGAVAWASNQPERGPSTLRVGDDGRLTLTRDRDGVVTWATTAWEPADATLVRNSSGGVAVVAGGAKAWFISPEELQSAGYAGTPSRLMSVPELDALLAVPRDGTLVRDRQTGGVWVLAGGSRMWFANPQELVTAGYGGKPSTAVPRRWIDTLPDNRPADGTLVKTGTSPQVWRITGGRRTAVTPAPGAAVTTIGESACNGIPLA